MDSHSKLYKKLYNSKAGIIIPVTIAVLILLIIIAVGIFGSLTIYNDGDLNSAIGTGCTALVGVIAYGIIVRKSLTKSIRLKIKKNERLNSLDIHELEILEEQIECSDYLYKTFYLLDSYMYVPVAKLLIRYDEIKEFKSIIHSTNGLQDGVFIALTDTDNLLHEFRVKKWKEYYKNTNSFYSILEEKKQKNISRNYHQETELV